MALISLTNGYLSFSDAPLLDHAELHIEPNERVCLVGRNGAGKSTLLKLMLGELKADDGEIKVLDKNIKDYKSYRDIGYVPQINIVNKIAFPITCLELVTLNLYEDFGMIKVARKKHYDKAKQIMEEMGMKEYINRPVNELSGGLQQRAMICRAMINEPKLLILDEPTAGVDKENKEKFIKTIAKLNKDYNITVIMVTHEIKEIEALDIERTQYEMIEGRLVKC